MPDILKNSLPIFVTLAFRELRGSRGKFKIFAACLILGVATITGIGSISANLSSGVDNNSRSLLGGDISLELSHRPLSPNIIQFLKTVGSISHMNTLRAMVRPSKGKKRTLVELKSVDNFYPLAGNLILKPYMPVAAALNPPVGPAGAVVDRALLQRMGLNIGDKIEIGNNSFVIKAELVREPDRIIRFTTFGPRVLIHSKSLAKTGLLVEGSLVKYIYKISLFNNKSANEVIKTLNKKFPSTGWRIRTTDNAVPGFDRFNNQVTQFLTLIAFTTLLVGGLGIGNSAKNYLEQRVSTIATLKCLGGENKLVFQIYFTQMFFMGVFCILIGIGTGAVIPILLSDLISEMIPITLPNAVFFKPLFLGFIYGILVTFIFTLLPLAKTTMIKPGYLFRSATTREIARTPNKFLFWIFGSFLSLAIISIINNSDQKLTFFFVIGISLLFFIFSFGSYVVKFFCSKLTHLQLRFLRLMLSNITRPGNLTTGIILSLGCGLTLLLTVALVENNLSRRLTSEIPNVAPSYFFIDIQPHQNEKFMRIVNNSPGVTKIEKTPMTRGRVVSVNGVLTKNVKPRQDIAWAIRGDRGLTYAAEKPPNAEIVSGNWWSEDYSGKPLISMGANVARGLNVDIGDTITFNILGREIRAEIANLRYIDWSNLQMNFVFIFSPGTLEAAPHSIIAAVYASGIEAAEQIRNNVVDSLTNVSSISVKDALKNAQDIITAVGFTIRTTTAFTLISGILVLASALATQQQKRQYEATIYKVLGMTRMQILFLYISEYLFLSLISAVLATLISTVTSWLILTKIMRSDFQLDAGAVILTLGISLLTMIALGLGSTWRSLSLKPGRVLANT